MATRMAAHENRIYNEVLDYIRQPFEAGFEPLALKVFSHQFARNPTYRKYCEAKDRTPDTVASWREIPAVPTDAFKELDLACGRPEKVFITSGTSQGPAKRGRHPVPRLDVYRTSALFNFSAHLLPDLAGMRMLILTGSPEIWPQSSLAHMMEMVRQEFGGEDAAYYINDSGLDLDRLLKTLTQACEQNAPVILLGVTPAFHQVLEHARNHRLTFRLPGGSRIMDTGGFKGRQLDLSKTELYRWYEEVFGIPQTHIVNEYGMTEMCSQFYDNVLMDSITGTPRPRHKRIPPWVRTLIVDPETLEELPPGSTGLIRHYDLANCGSVMALQTKDIGHAIGDGFEITGRASGAESRGCSLIIEELRGGPMTDRSTLDGFLLPPTIKVSSFTKLKFGAVQIRLPVLTATTLSDVINHLLVAQEQYLSRQSTEAILKIIDAAVARWLKPDDPMRKTAETVLPSITGLSPEMVRLGLTRMLEGYRKKTLYRILDEELGDIRLLDAFQPTKEDPARLIRAMGPRITTNVLSGNIPGLGAADMIATLLVKSACLCKVSSYEPLFTTLFAQTLVQIEPRLAHCLAVLGWPGGKPESKSLEAVAFSRSELVIATGSDEAVSAVRLAAADHQPASARFIGYGHRISLGLIGREALDDIKSIARNAALDVVMYDQQGCLSPHLFYVETGGAHFPRQFAKALGLELARLEKELPRGPVDTPTAARLHQIRSVAEIKQADGEEVIVFGSETGTLWTVIYETDPAFVLSPLYRTVRVKPINDLLQIIPLLEYWRPYLQAAGIAVSETRHLTLAEALGRAGVNRICPIGRMQQPPAGWPQDGRRFIADRVRWVELELP